MTHVLIVEDSEEDRYLLQLLLEVNGYRVTAAGNGLEALAAARRDPPEVIVSDVLMPKLDGFALCRAWMQNAAFRAIPFIFYSATYVRPDDAQFAMALGAVRYLIKPLEAEAFLAELRAVLQQWAGRAAPGPATPLDEAASHALHASALARKMDDRMAQLEAANRALAEAEARYRSLVEQWYGGIFVIQEQKLAYCNPRFAQILGYRAQADLTGRDLLSIVAENDVAAVADTLRRMLEQETGPASHAFAAVRKDGCIVDLALEGARATYLGRPAILGMMQEISAKMGAGQ